MDWLDYALWGGLLLCVAWRLIVGPGAAWFGCFLARKGGDPWQ